MRRALNLEKDADLQARKAAAHLGNAQRRVAADAFELHRLLEPVTGNIGLDLGDHRLDARPDLVAVAVVAQAIDGIAHDQRRFGGFAMADQHFAVPLVRTCRCCVEDDGDVGKARHRDQPVEAGGSDRHAQSFSALQPVARGIDADEGAHLQHLGQAHDLDHQVGADVARSDDCDLGLRHRVSPRHR